MPQEGSEEQRMEMEMDDVELALRRFATSTNNQQLMKLLSSMFIETAEQKVKHEMAFGDMSEDKKEGE